VTALVHGAEALAAAEQAAAVLFGATRGTPPRPDWRWWLGRCRSRPSSRVSPWRRGWTSSPSSSATGLATSQGDARRQLEQHGISVNGDKAEPDRRLTRTDLLHDRWVLLRKGKKGWAALDAGA
jgi:tyrosyl-tRNA synthetase